MRLPLMALALLSLVAALWAGLVRLGWPMPTLSFLPSGHHGAFMVSGFLGTLITLERAVALRQNRQATRRGPESGELRYDTRLYYVAPLLSGLGAVGLLVGVPLWVAQSFIVAGSLGLVLIFAVIYRLQPDAANATMALGAMAWLAGNALWLAEEPLFRAVPWWVGFLVLTIAGERLELSRILLWDRRSRLLFYGATATFLGGLLLSLPSFDAGVHLSGVGLAALGLWLLRYDVARRTIRNRGLTRFIAACLLPGYVWLTFGGALWIGTGGQFVAGLVYDAMLHSVFLGFVFSMIFGHAPVIIPAVLGRPVPYRPLFYGPLFLLHTSLLLRVWGDLAILPVARRWGGLLNEVAILLFLAVTIFSALQAQGSSPGEGRRAPTVPASRQVETGAK